MTTATEGRSRGLAYVLAATAVAGLSGYLIQILAAALLPGADAYLSFSAFWSTIYLLGSAVGGVQQEVARATRSVSGGERSGAGVRIFTAVAAVLTVILAGTVGVLLGSMAFGQDSVPMGVALAVGLLGYVLTAVATGLFYGLHRLGAVAALITIDAVLRGIAVVGSLLLGMPIEVTAFAIALPFGAAVALVWLLVRRTVVGAYRLDVSAGKLARNAAHTVIAAAATGLMVTGMPLLFRLSLTDASAVAVASLTLVVTLTRAPFIIPIMALQSFLVVSFRDSAAETGRRLRRYLALAGGVGVVAVFAGWFAGPWVVAWISGDAYAVDGATSALVVASAVLVGCMCITGPALLARHSHRVFASGWVVAAVCTVVVLFLLPVSAEPRALVALVVAPLSGLIVHMAALVRRNPKAT